MSPVPPLQRPPHPAEPRAARRRTARIRHGIRLTDDFAWLRARNWREVIENPAALPQTIADYLAAENGYSAAALKPLGALQKALVREMRARMPEEDADPPVKSGEFFYFERFRKGKQYPLFCRRPAARQRVEILLDGPHEARGHGYFDLGTLEPSPDHARLAWSADTTGAESYTIRVRSFLKGRSARDKTRDSDRLVRTSGEVLWGRAGTYLYYVELDAAQRPYRVMRHRLGETQRADVEIYREAGSGWFVGLDATQDDRFGLITIHDHATSEVRYFDLADAAATPIPLFPRDSGVEYEAEHHDGRFIIRTNHGGARDFKIVALAVGETDITRAELLVPQTPGRVLDSVDVLKDWLIWSDLGEDGPAVRVRHWASGREQVFRSRAPVGDIVTMRGREFATDTLRLSFSSPTEPEITVDHNLASGAETILKVQQVPSGHDPEAYIVERLQAAAADGEMIPVTLLRRRETPIDGTAPALLYGYGAYGHAIDADFGTERLSLVDRGFVYAIAHVRGGKEKGDAWYRAGKLARKVNSFTDFIAVADFLVARGYAAPARIVAQGASAGGMLMGAIANRAGEKFAGIIAEVPFVDCLTTMLDATLPLTPPEWEEWGNPIEDPAIFAAMRAYSPYDTITAKHYPPMLVTAGLSDPRVTYWEPAKFVAKLRATMTGGGPILLHTDMGAGHGGASGRFAQLVDTARAYAFALAVVGLAEAVPAGQPGPA